jgi:electron transport complex protein RnfC
MIAFRRGVREFARGIHPPHRKYTAGHPIQLFVPTRDVIVPMAQHIGAACTPIVKARQAVTLGEKIADVEAFIAAPIHASITGTVGNGAICLLPAGRRVPALPISRSKDAPPDDGSFLRDFLDRSWDDVDAAKFDPDEICAKIREGGIVGQGGATFPTYVKLKRNPQRPVDTVLLNGAECEPYLTADHRLMLECPEGIIAGLQLAMRACGAGSGLICIENNKPDAIEAMRRASRGRAGLEVVVCASKYPMGGERQLIPAVLGRVVPSAPSGLPLDVGVVVINVATAHAIARAVARGKPLTHRVVTVTGEGVNRPGNWLVPIGTILADLIESACGGLKGTDVRLLAGGPMMGPALPHWEIPIVKGTGGITALPSRAVPAETPCIRCGRCLGHCPLRLSPSKIAQAVRQRDYDLAASLDANACCECGCCAFVCPAHIPLPQYIRAGKLQLRSRPAPVQAAKESRS